MRLYGCVILLLISAPASAHHGLAGEYDLASPVTIRGFVRSIEIVNPHTVVEIVVSQPSGSKLCWVRMGPPASFKVQLNENIWVTVRGFPSRATLSADGPCEVWGEAIVPEST